MQIFGDYREALIEQLRKNPRELKAYLEVALEEYEIDGDAVAFLRSLKTVAEAQGGLTQLAKKTHLSRQSLYKIFSSKGNPRLNTIGAILHGLGYTLALKPLARS